MTSLQNSIRHNLSLHNRFMRVQNEGTGKSSWWMLNPDAKPGKSVRRRAASMETSKFEKRRGRVKKRVEQLRNGVLTSEITNWLSEAWFFVTPQAILIFSDVTGVLNDVNSSPGSSVSEGLDLFPESPLHRYLLSSWRVKVANEARKILGSIMNGEDFVYSLLGAKQRGLKQNKVFSDRPQFSFEFWAAPNFFNILSFGCVQWFDSKNYRWVDKP